MIKINLLGDETVIDTSGTWLMIGYVLSLGVTVLVCGLLYYSLTSRVQEAGAEKESLTQDLARLQEKTKIVRDLEARKKDLIDKTAVIATLKKNKLGPVRILDDLNSAIPERAWLTEVRESGGQMRVSGYALDNHTVAKFINELGRSGYFELVDLNDLRKVDKGGAQIIEFSLNTKVAYAGGVKKSLSPTSMDLIGVPLAAVTPLPSAGGSPEPSPAPETSETPDR